MDRKERLAPLGAARLQLLACLGGDDPQGSAFFSPELAETVFAAYRDYMLALSARLQDETSPLLAALLAAGRLMSGEIAAARLIVDSLPAQPVKLDHGAGYCLIAPVAALKATLPFPPPLDATKTWTAGSPTQAAMVDWLSRNQDRLRWSAVEGVYRLAVKRDDAPLN